MPTASKETRSEVRGLDQELKAIVPATAEQSVSAMSLTNKTGEAATPKAASALMRPSLESLPGYPIAPNMLPANEANHYATAFTSDVAGEIIQAVSKQGKARSITHLMLDGAQVSVTITVDEHLVKEGLDAERIASLIEKGYAALSDDEKTRFKSAITARRYVFGSIGRKDNKWQSRRLFESISDPLAAQGVIGVNEYLFQQGMEDPLLITQLFAGLPGTGEVLRDKARFDGMYRALGGAGDALESVRQWNASAENKRYNINAQVAENFITAAHDEYQFISDDKGEMGHVYAELKEIVDRLLAAEGYDPRSFHFHLADMSECNAFVVQFSNHIVLNTGLLWAFTQAIAGERTNANKGKLQSFFKEHVAFVIAHEIAHLKQSRDRVNSGDTPEPETMETIRKSMKESPWNKLMEKFKDHAKAYGYERDADNYAINIMDRAGYSVRNAYLPFTFFSEVIESQKGNKMVSWAKDLRDVHPTLPSRIADIKKSLRPAYFLSYEAPFEAFSSGFLEELLAWKGDGKSYLLKRTRPRDYSAKTMSVQSAQDFAHVIDDSASWEEWEMASHAGAFSYLNARGREYYASKEHRAEAEEARAVMREIVHEMRDSEKKIMALIKQNWKQWGMSEREYEELQDKMSYFFTYFYCDGIEYEIKDLKDEQLFSGWFIHLFTKKSDVEISLKDFAYPVFGGSRVYTENQTAHFAMEQAMQEAKGRIRDIVAGERFKGLRRRIEGDRDIQSELTGIRDVIRKNFDRLSRDKKLQDVSSRSSRFHSRYSFQRSFFDTPHFRVEEAGEDDDIKSPLKGLAGVPEPHEIGKISDMLEDVLAAAWSFDFIEQDEAAIKSRKLLAGLNYLPDNELRELHRSSVGKMAGAIESTFLSRLEELEARHDRGEAVQLPSIDQLIELLDKVINYQAIASERFGPSYEMGQIGKKLQEAIVARLQKNASLVTQEKLGKLLTVLTRNPEWVSGNPNLRRFLWENLIYNAQNYAHFRKDIQLLIHEIGNHQVIMDKGFSTYGITFDEIFPNGLADSRLQSNRYFDGVHGSPEDAARVFLEAYDLLGLSERNSEAYLENLFVKTERAFGLESSESRLKLYENILESAEGQGKIYLNLDASVGLMRPLAYAITTRAEGIMRGAVSFCELMTAKNIPLEVSGAWTSENYTKAAGSLRRSGKQVFKGHTIDAQGYLIEFEDNITEEDFDGSVKDATLLEVFRRSRQSTADVQQILQHIDSYLSRMSGNLGLDPQFVASIPSLHPEVRRFMYLFAIGGMVSMKDFYRFIKTHSETWSNEDIEALSYFLNRIAQFQQKRNLVGGTHRLTGSDLSSLEAQTWQQYLVPLALFAVQKRFSFKVDDDSSFSEAIEKKEDASSTTNPYHVLIGELVGTDASIKANAMKAVHRAPQKSIDRFDFSGMPKERVREIFAFIAQNADKDFDYWISYAERYMPASAMRNMFLYCVLWEKSLKPRLNAKDGEEPDLFYSWEFVSGVLSKSDLMKDDNVRNATARIEKLLVEDTVIKNLNAEGLGELFKNMASGGEKEKAAMKRGFIGRNLYIARYLTLNLIKMGIARPFFFLCWLGFKVLALLKGMGIPVRRATRIFHGMIEFPIDIFYNHDDSVTALFKSASLFKDDPLKMALLSKVMWSLAYMIFYNRLRVLPPARFILSSYFSLVKLMEKTPRVPWQFNEYGNIHSQIDLMAAYPNKGHLMGRAQSVGASWEDRLKEVESFFPRSSPVRDELLLGLAGTMPSSEGFKNLPVRDKENVLQALRTISGKVFQPFFREKLAMQALDLAIMAEEERTGQKISFDREVALIFEYFPDYSFTRDDVLYEVMEHARNPEAYQRLYSQILQVQDNASKESVREKIFGEHKIKELIQNADPLDKEEIALWIMGIRAEKPFAVQEMEWLNRIDMGYFKDLFNEVASTRYKTVGSTAKKDMMEALFGGKSGLMQDEFLFKNFLNKVFETSCPKSITNRSKLKTVFMTVFEHIPDEKKLDVIGAMATKIKPGVKTDIADLTKTFFESMGIIGIKLAQIISHSDAGETMDETVRLALADLSSSADPYGKKYAFQMLGLAFGERFGEHFSEIGKRLGSASIKVVYKVTLQDGRTLVMKLKRPDIDKTIEPQLKTLSGILDALTAKGVNVPPGLGDQIGMYIREEVDFGIEVRNQGRLQKNLSGRGEVALGGKKVTFVAPRSYTKEDLPELFNSIPKALQGVVMLEEYFPGVEFKAEELKKELGLTDQGVKDLKLTVFQELMTQVFKDGFFHADPHKGNILVRKESDGNIKAALIDLGSMGEVKDKFKLAQWLMYMATHKGETPKIPQEYILEAMFFKKIWYLMETMEPLEVAKEIFEKLLPEYQFPKDVERQLKVIDLAAKGKWQQITAGDYKLGVLDKVKEIYYNWRFGKGMGEMAGKPTGENVFSSGNAALPAVNPGAVSGPQDQTRSEMRDLGQGLKAAALSAALLASGLSGSVAEQQRDEAGKAARVELVNVQQNLTQAIQPMSQKEYGEMVARVPLLSGFPEENLKAFSYQDYRKALENPTAEHAELLAQANKIVSTSPEIPAEVRTSFNFAKGAVVIVPSGVFPDDVPGTIDRVSRTVFVNDQYIQNGPEGVFAKAIRLVDVVAHERKHDQLGYDFMANGTYNFKKHVGVEILVYDAITLPLLEQFPQAFPEGQYGKVKGMVEGARKGDLGAMKKITGAPSEEQSQTKTITRQEVRSEARAQIREDLQILDSWQYDNDKGMLERLRSGKLADIAYLDFLFDEYFQSEDVDAQFEILRLLTISQQGLKRLQEDPRFKGQGLKAPDVLRAILSNYLKFIATNQMVALEDKLLFQDASAVTPELQNWGRAQFYSSANKKQFYKNSVPVTVATVTEDLKKAGFDIAEKEVADNLDKENFLVLENGLIISTVDIENNAFRGSREKDAEFARYLTRNVIGAYDYGTRGGELASDAHAWSKALKPATGPKALHEIDFNLVLERIATGSIVPAPDEVYLAKAFKHVQDQSKTFKGARKRTILLEKDDGSLKSTVDILQELQRYQKAERELKPKYLNLLTRYVTASEGERVGIISEISPVFLSLTTQAKLLPEYIMEYFGNDFDESTAARLKQRLEAEQLKTKEFRQELAGQPMVRPDIKPETGPRSEQRVADETALKSVAPRVADALKPGSKNRVLGEANTRAVYEVTVRGDGGALIEALKLVVEEEMAKAEITAKASATTVRVTKEMADAMVQRVLAALEASKIKGNLTIGFDVSPDKNFMEAMRALKDRIGTAVFPKDQSRKLDRKSLEGVIIQTVGSLKSYNPLAAENARAVPVLSQNLDSEYFANEALFGVGSDGNVQGEPFLDVAENVVRIAVGLLKADLMTKGLKSEEINDKLLEMLFNLKVGSSHGVLSMNGRHLVVHREALEQIMREYQASSEVSKAA
jgi:signal transduction histidine kinase